VSTDRPDDPGDIRGWQRLSAAVTTSGKLSPEDPARLAAVGVRHVVNLALDSHEDALAGEAELLAAEGIGYTHIPIPFDAPDEAHYAVFKAALDAAQGPVHVHCIMNWRVSGLFYRLHREHGMPEAAARAVMQQQWDPFASDHPAALAWAELIAR
jgi:uncharacterized protein (TIGR01244 family)